MNKTRPPGVYLDAISRNTRTRVAVVKRDDVYQAICEHYRMPPLANPSHTEALYAARNSYEWCADCAEAGGFDPPEIAYTPRTDCELCLGENVVAVIIRNDVPLFDQVWWCVGDDRYRKLADTVRRMNLRVTRVEGSSAPSEWAGSWWTRAACRGLRHVHHEDAWDVWRQRRTNDFEVARAVCVACPSRFACATAALEEAGAGRDIESVWAGAEPTLIRSVAAAGGSGRGLVEAADRASEERAERPLQAVLALTDT